MGSFGAFCSGDVGPGTVFDRLGLPGLLLGAAPMEARTEPEARTETDAPSSISVSIARAKAPADLAVVCVAADVLLECNTPAKDVAEEADAADFSDAAEI